MGKTPEQYDANDEWFDYDETHSRSVVGDSGVKIPEKVVYAGALTAAGLVAGIIATHKIRKNSNEEK